jgi:hypothetical protein
MNTAPLRALIALAGASALAGFSGCASLHASAWDAFDHGMLNATWYGGYHRPLVAEGSDGAPGAESEGWLARRREAVEARREAREERRTARRAAPVSPTAVAAQSAGSGSGTTASASPARDGGLAWDPVLAAAYVRDTYDLNGAPFGPDAQSLVDLYRHAVRSGVLYHSEYPAAGDVVFFSNTWDRNGDGRDNDYYTHAGIVEDVTDDGTISILSWVDGAVQRTYMNLVEGQAHRRDDRVLNTPLRPRTGDEGSAAWLSSHLFAGFAAFLSEEVETVELMGRWEPGMQTAQHGQ